MSYKIVSLLRSDADSLLNPTCNTISKGSIRKLTPNYIEDSFVHFNRSPQVFHGNSDLSDAVNTAVNNRAVGVGLILESKSLQRPFKEGVVLLHAVQDVYLCPKIDLAYLSRNN